MRKERNLSPEQVQEFVEWQQAEPNRKVDIKIGEASYSNKIEVAPGEFVTPNYRILVTGYVGRHYTCQHVNFVSEIDLLAEAKKQLQRNIDELEKIEGSDSNAN